MRTGCLQTGARCGNNFISLYRTIVPSFTNRPGLSTRQLSGSKRMKSLLSKLWRDEDGSMAEYAVSLGLITVAVVAAMALIGSDIGAFLSTASAALSTAVA